MARQTVHSAEDLEAEDLVRLGECVRDIVARLGYGNGSSHEAILFREAVDEAMYLLTLRQGSRASRNELYAQRGFPPSKSPPLAMEDLAQDIINRSFARNEEARPTQAALRERVRFALALDPRCADAYHLQGEIEEHTGHYQKAQASYEQAMEIAAEKLGLDAFRRDVQTGHHLHFWYSEGTRPYMQARAALAHLLWRKLNKLEEAISHFQELLRLNPGDNQGNRHAFLCCLLESGDDSALEAALEQCRTYSEAALEPVDITDTCWWYAYACWQFRRHRSSTGESSTPKEATKALRKAFTYNRHVPHLLLHPEDLRAIPDSWHYAPGDIHEAAWVVDYSVSAWQRTPGALTWLETVARRAKLLSTKAKG